MQGHISGPLEQTEDASKDCTYVETHMHEGGVWHNRKKCPLNNSGTVCSLDGGK